MNRVIFPDSKYGWTGTYKGDIYGSLWSSFQIDIDDKRGFISPSHRLYRVMDNGLDADFDVPVAFVRTSADGTDRYWCLANKYLFKTVALDVSRTNWQQDPTTNSPTAAAYDMCVYGGDLYVFVLGGSDNIAQLSGGTWTSTWWSTAGGATLPFGKEHALDNFLDLLLIGSENHIHTWDGTVVSNNAITLPSGYEVVWIRHTSDYAIIGAKNIEGGEAKIFFWDGTSTTYNYYYGVGDNNVYSGVVVNNIPYVINGNGTLMKFSGGGFVPIPNIIDLGQVKPNGMTSYEGGFLVLTNEFYIHQDDKRNPDGVYYYNMDTNVLSHRYSIGQYDGTTSYDNGQIYIGGTVGAVFYDNTNLLVGSYYDYSGTGKKAIFSIKSSYYDHSYFITPKIMSDKGFGFYRDVILKFLKLKNTYNDKIVIKYRTEDGSVNSQYITWVSATTFSLSFLYSDAKEALFCDGDSAGNSREITDISSASPHIYTIDSSIYSASSGLSYVTFSNWEKLGEVTDKVTQSKLFAILKRAEWIQFKVEIISGGGKRSPMVTSLILDKKESLR